MILTKPIGVSGPVSAGTGAELSDELCGGHETKLTE